MDFKKKDTMVCCLQETHFSFKATHRLRVKRWRKIRHENGSQRKVGITRLMSDIIDFKPETE